MIISMTPFRQIILLSRNEHVFNFSQEQWRVLQINLSAETRWIRSREKQRIYQCRINIFHRLISAFPRTNLEETKSVIFRIQRQSFGDCMGTTDKSTRNTSAFYNNDRSLLDYSRKNSNYYVRMNSVRHQK